jgi:hypothetical protein
VLVLSDYRRRGTFLKGKEMNLSYHALEKMGYRRLLPNESLTAAFSSVTVFSMQGISLPENSLLTSAGAVDGTPYSMCLANSVNAASNALTSEDFCEDETEWLTQNNCSPPFLLILIGPTSLHAMTGDFIQTDGTLQMTYDGFPAAKVELRALEEKALPSVLSSLACAFNASESSVSLKTLAREAFGKTTAGTVVLDHKFTMEGSLSVSRPLKNEDAEVCLARARTLASSMSPKVSRYFNLAIHEQDPLKRFLYFFLTIERQTHSAFASAHDTSHIQAILQSPERVRAAADEFFNRQIDRWTNLRDRFIWCAVSVWTHLNDIDLQTFERVKKVRDQIAHGEVATPPAEIVADVERLAIKLQLGL